MGKKVREVHVPLSCGALKTLTPFYHGKLRFEVFGKTRRKTGETPSPSLPLCLSISARSLALSKALYLSEFLSKSLRLELTSSKIDQMYLFCTDKAADTPTRVQRYTHVNATLLNSIPMKNHTCAPSAVFTDERG